MKAKDDAQAEQYKRRQQVAYVEQKAAEEAEAEQSEIRRLSRSLADGISNVRNTRIPENISTASSAINDKRQYLQEMEQKLREIEVKTSNRPLSCYQAFNELAYDFERALTYIYQRNLGGYVNRIYRKNVEAAQERLNSGGSEILRIREDGNNLQEAVRASKYPFPTLEAEPGSEKKPIADYEAVRASALTRLANLQADNAIIIERSGNIMKQAERVVMETQNRMKRRCKIRLM